MKKALLVTSLILSICQQSLAQELVYQQDHGVSFNKGNIDTDVLIAIIQEKQDELNKFVLSRIVTKTWIENKNNNLDSSRLDNFTTKYLIYKTLNELTISTDKSKFGKSTLELLKEVSIIYGLAVAVDQNYSVKDPLNTQEDATKSLQEIVTIKPTEDGGRFNIMLDLILDICISDPDLKGYFPTLSQLSNLQDDDRAWYEKDSEYYSIRSQPAILAKYKATEDLLSKAMHYIEDLRNTIANPTKDQIWEMVGTVYIDYFAQADIERFVEIKNTVNSIGNDTNEILDKILLEVVALTSGMGPLDNDFLMKVKQITFDYSQFKNTLKKDDLFYSNDRINELLSNIRKKWKKEWDKNPAIKQLLDDLEASVINNDWIEKKMIVNWMERLIKELPEAETEFSELQKYLSSPLFKIDEALSKLEKIGERYEMIESFVLLFHSTKENTGLNHFQLDSTQLDNSKELLNKFISYIDKSGKYNVASIYLRSLIDNITYMKSTENKLASVSLNFESVLYEINDKLVVPARLERTKYFQLYLNIGVNYCGFLNSNDLSILSENSTESLKSIAFASEKIGIKYKFTNQKYTRSFKPGVVFRYRGKNRSWYRPQPKSILDDIFIDLHTGGLLYNVVNLKTDQNFNFPFVGVGLGCRSFNGITFSASLNQPYTHNTFNTKNLFFMFSIDIPIIEYINKLRSK